MGGSFLIVLLAMFAFMYLLLIRPQRQQQRRHAEMVEALKEGDEVVTVGGIYGDVTEVRPDRVTLEIAEDVEIEVAKRAIASIVPPEARDEELEQAAGDAEPAPEPEPATEARLAEEDAARR
jgi:preprotein translocase subunit YajC